MTIRWKLNVSVAGLLAVLLVAVAIAMNAVDDSARRLRSQARTRQLSQFTSDLRTILYEHLALEGDLIRPRETSERLPWPDFVLQDVEVQIRLAPFDWERGLWKDVRGAVAEMAQIERSQHSDTAIQVALNRAERALRELRNRYDLAEHDALASVASTSFHAQVTIGVASMVTVLLFLIYRIMVRDWLVKPIETLKKSADIIGEGRLDHCVPLEGNNELTQLARRIDAMAASLNRNQTALLEARELTAIGEVCANVAHGLRNPLAAMRACAQLAARHVDSSGRAKEMIRDLVSQADHMDARITKLFEFSKPYALNRQRTTFHELAGKAKREAESLLADRSITLRVEDETAGASWSLDRERLAGALGELVSNAVHHSPDGGEIILRGTAAPSANGTTPALILQVIDRGSGMSPATLSKAGDLFFTGRPGGTGVGLALVRRLAEEHAGTLTLESEQGKGTTVTLNIPHDGAP
ncbi:MAG: HAMP domain-containing histidine kinase [Planctomycetes bacterium]|nr:HAMP domain-containing histidine kinase [Planctomycetota bacterium]